MLEIKSPIKGRVIPLGELSDPAFASGILGIGIGIEPQEGKVFAPADGKIDIFPTNHAITMVTKEGVQLIIHIGINTVGLNGKGFKPNAKSGDTVKAGQLLMEVDIKKIKKGGCSVETPIVITNHEEYKEIIITTANNVEVRHNIFSINL